MDREAATTLRVAGRPLSSIKCLLSIVTLLCLPYKPRCHPLSFTSTAPFCLAPLPQQAKTIECAKNDNRRYDDAVENNLDHPLLSSLHKMPEIWLRSTTSGCSDCHAFWVLRSCRHHNSYPSHCYTEGSPKSRFQNMV
jgi:hypothetical protein